MIQSKMDKSRDIMWDYFVRFKANNNRVRARCLKCSKELEAILDRLRVHHSKCSGIHPYPTTPDYSNSEALSVVRVPTRPPLPLLMDVPKIVKKGDTIITSYVDEKTGKVGVYEIGIKIEVSDAGGKWFPAKVVEIDKNRKEVLVHFENWSPRFDEWIHMDSDRIRPTANTNVIVTQFKEGEKVEALWSTDGQKYPGVIQSILPNDYYQVLFDDGIKLKKKYSQIFKLRPLPPLRSSSSSSSSSYPTPPLPELIPFPKLLPPPPSPPSSSSSNTNTNLALMSKLPPPLTPMSITTGNNEEEEGSGIMPFLKHSSSSLSITPLSRVKRRREGSVVRSEESKPISSVLPPAKTFLALPAPPTPPLKSVPLESLVTPSPKLALALPPPPPKEETPLSSKRKRTIQDYSTLLRPQIYEKEETTPKSKRVRKKPEPLPPQLTPQIEWKPSPKALPTSEKKEEKNGEKSGQIEALCEKEEEKKVEKLVLKKKRGRPWKSKEMRDKEKKEWEERMREEVEKIKGEMLEKRDEKVKKNEKIDKISGEENDKLSLDVKISIDESNSGLSSSVEIKNVEKAENSGSGESSISAIAIIDNSEKIESEKVEKSELISEKEEKSEKIGENVDESLVPSVIEAVKRTRQRRRTFEIVVETPAVETPPGEEPLTSKRKRTIHDYSMLLKTRPKFIDIDDEPPKKPPQRRASRKIVEETVADKEIVDKNIVGEKNVIADKNTVASSSGLSTSPGEKDKKDEGSSRAKKIKIDEIGTSSSSDSALAIWAPAKKTEPIETVSGAKPASNQSEGGAKSVPSQSEGGAKVSSQSGGVAKISSSQSVGGAKAGSSQSGGVAKTASSQSGGVAKISSSQSGGVAKGSVQSGGGAKAGSSQSGAVAKIPSSQSGGGAKGSEQSGGGAKLNASQSLVVEKKSVVIAPGPSLAASRPLRRTSSQFARRGVVVDEEIDVLTSPLIPKIRGSEAAAAHLAKFPDSSLISIPLPDTPPESRIKKSRPPSVSTRHLPDPSSSPSSSKDKSKDVSKDKEADKTVRPSLLLGSRLNEIYNSLIDEEEEEEELLDIDASSSSAPPPPPQKTSIKTPISKVSEKSDKGVKSEKIVRSEVGGGGGSEEKNEGGGGGSKKKSRGGLRVRREFGVSRKRIHGGRWWRRKGGNKVRDRTASSSENANRRSSGSKKSQVKKVELRAGDLLSGISSKRVKVIRRNVFGLGFNKKIYAEPAFKDVSVDIISCICGVTDEHGLMVQCEYCQCWQHGQCFDIETVKDMPSNYICDACLSPQKVRSNMVNDWSYEIHKAVQLPRFQFGPPVNPQLEKLMRETNDLMERAFQVREILHTSRIHLQIMSSSPPHPKLYQWDSPQPGIGQTVQERKFNKVYRPLLRRLLYFNRHDGGYVERLKEKVRGYLEEKEEEERVKREKWAQKENSLTKNAKNIEEEEDEEEEEEEEEEGFFSKITVNDESEVKNIMREMLRKLEEEDGECGDEELFAPTNHSEKNTEILSNSLKNATKIKNETLVYATNEKTHLKNSSNSSTKSQNTEEGGVKILDKTQNYNSTLVNKSQNGDNELKIMKLSEISPSKSQENSEIRPNNAEKSENTNKKQVEVSKVENMAKNLTEAQSSSFSQDFYKFSPDKEVKSFEMTNLGSDETTKNELSKIMEFVSDSDIIPTALAEDFVKSYNEEGESFIKTLAETMREDESELYNFLDDDAFIECFNPHQNIDSTPSHFDSPKKSPPTENKSTPQPQAPNLTRITPELCRENLALTILDQQRVVDEHMAAIEKRVSELELIVFDESELGGGADERRARVETELSDLLEQFSLLRKMGSKFEEELSEFYRTSSSQNTNNETPPPPHSTTPPTSQFPTNENAGFYLAPNERGTGFYVAANQIGGYFSAHERGGSGSYGSTNERGGSGSNFSANERGGIGGYGSTNESEGRRRRSEMEIEEEEGDEETDSIEEEEEEEDDEDEEESEEEEEEDEEEESESDMDE